MGTPLSRRNLVAGTCAAIAASGLVGATRVFASGESAEKKEEIIRTYYSGWEKKDWNLTAAVITDNFTFSSPAGDDHIPISVFKKRCFLNQMDLIKDFEFESIVSRGDEAFVKYVCRTTKGTSFTNVEYFHFAGGKVASVECYFGGTLGYPAASVSGVS